MNLCHVSLGGGCYPLVCLDHRKSSRESVRRSSFNTGPAPWDVHSTTGSCWNLAGSKVVWPWKKTWGVSCWDRIFYLPILFETAPFKNHWDGFGIAIFFFGLLKKLRLCHLLTDLSRKCRWLVFGRLPPAIQVSSPNLPAFSFVARWRNIEFGKIPGGQTPGETMLSPRVLLFQKIHNIDFRTKKNS